MNAFKVSYLGTNSPLNGVTNSIKNIVVLLAGDARSKCVLIAPPAGGLATFSIKFKGQILINGVTLIPTYSTT